MERGLGGLIPINSENSDIGWDLDEVDNSPYDNLYLDKIVKWITQHI